VEEVNNRSDSLSVIDLRRESTPVVFKSLDTSSSINELRFYSDRDLDHKTAFSSSMEKIVSHSDIDNTFLSPLVAKYKRILDTHDQELTLMEKKEACRKNDPKFIAKNQEKEDHEEACRKRREKYHSSEYSKKKMMKQEVDRARKREVRSKFTMTDVLKEKINKKSALRRQRTKEAKLLNDLFPYDKSKFPVEWMERPPKKTCMKENDRSYLMYPERMGTVFKGTKGSFRDAGGKVMSDGMTMSITTNSFAKVMFMLLRKLDTKKGRNMVTLDLGSGQGIPSILMGQFFGDGCLGLHIGIEQDPGLVASSRYNAKLVATKALVNFNRGYFHKQYIQNHGETEHTCFPNALFVHGDICNITSLKPFDVLYGFDAANCYKSKRHVADLWNQANPENRNSHGMSECPNPKHLLSNSNFQEIMNLGFRDIFQFSQVEVRFSGSNEGRVTYHYGRKSLLKKGKNNQTYSYENPLPVDKVCPIFQSAWKDYLTGRSQMEKASRTCPCNQAILDRLLSDGYYLETLPKRTDRVRHIRSMKIADLEAAAWKGYKPVEVVEADDAGTIFSNISTISE
jgi:SAM-dependent methyltransferase